MLGAAPVANALRGVGMKRVIIAVYLIRDASALTSRLRGILFWPLAMPRKSRSDHRVVSENRVASGVKRQVSPAEKARQRQQRGGNIGAQAKE